MINFFKQYDANTKRGPNFVGEETLPDLPPEAHVVKPIAFYLPQFHAIAENDSWWGKGFTEWTNVTKALPRYVGHRQPRLPANLGFYDLSQVQTLRDQAELVRRSGVYGLCIHDYWFGGRKVLETPLRLLLANPDIDLRFCVNWANENWSRRWDGSDHDILLEQTYAPEDRDGYAHSILPAVRDSRYIRVDGRPLVLVYRPSLLPDARGTFESWRELFLKEGVGDPYLVMVQSFDDYDPHPYGLDAAAGFPPHNANTWDINERNRLRLLDPAFEGHTRSYSYLAARMLQNHSSNYPLFPGVCPSWDNEARKPGRGTSFYNANPAAFENWLHQAAAQAPYAPGGDRFVFINAWNEWAEGAVLEPDRHYGFANLVAVRRVVDRLSDSQLEAKPADEESWATTHPSALNLIRNLPRRIIHRAKRKVAK